MANRHLSRSIVLQALFEWDFNSFDEDKALAVLDRNIKEFGPGLDDDSFMVSLLKQVLEKKEIINEVIEKAAPEWPLEKISNVDRNILRLGLAELLFGDYKEVPPKVAINEAIELAKTFGGENSSRFINGVLGAVYKEIGEPGKDEKSKVRNNNQEMDISKMPVEKLGGAIVYALKDNQIFLALVHDVFGYWTLSKGKMEAGENEEKGTIREVKEEIGLDISIKEKIGENEYTMSHPERGKIRKKVTYFLSESVFQDLKLESSGGLDDARWFSLEEIGELKIYDDIVPLLTKSISIITEKYLK